MKICLEFNILPSAQFCNSANLLFVPTGTIMLSLNQGLGQKKNMWGGTRTEVRRHWIWSPSSTFPHQNRPIYYWLLVFHRQSTLITENSRKRIMRTKCLSKMRETANKGTATARTVEVCAIQFVKVFYTRLLRSKLLESCSFPRYQVKCALFPLSLEFVLKLVVAGIFRKNGR